MLEFPFYSFGFLNIAFVIGGSLLLIQSLYQIFSGKDDEEEVSFRSILGVLGGILLLIVGLLVGIGFSWSTYNFRNIDISQVKGFRVIKSADEYSTNNSTFIFFEDTHAAQEALKTLKSCYSTSRNHESYQDGYKLQIIFSDETLEHDLYLSIFRKSNNKSNKSVVIPHYYINKNLNLGEYNCPDFQNWVQKNINPLFQDK